MLPVFMKLRFSEGKRILAIAPLLGSVLFNLSGLHVELARTDKRILIDFR
jgi:hypothetical protein